MDWDQIPDIPTKDFNPFLHELRARELRRMPPGAKTVLSGGASGRWYFEWFKQCYPSLTRHIGVEVYLPKPTDLPPEAVWIANYLGNMHDVRTGEVDLVFAGQTIEHMWPDDVTNFLCESHRVLSPDGLLVLDSPNRRITEALGWHMPEHTAEYTTDEIVDLVRAAGFDRIEVRGVWLCYDREGHALLPLFAADTPREWPWKRRVALSSDRPEDCFVWWIEARRSAAKPDRARILDLANRAYHLAFTPAIHRELRAIGKVSGWGPNRFVTTEVGEHGTPGHGPYIPLRAGKYSVRFGVGRRAFSGSPDPAAVACQFDVLASRSDQILARRALTVGELPAGELVEIVLPFEVARTEFGVEFRMFSTGAVPMAFRTQKDLVELDTVAAVLR